MLVFDRHQSAESGGHPELTGVQASRSSSNGARPTGSAPAVEVARPQPFAVDVQRRNGVAIVQPHGELDLATAQTLRAALDRVENAGRLMLDLRGLSFIDSTGLHLLVALHQHAQRDGFQLTLVAPAAPADKAIQLSGLDQALPFVAADDVDDRHPSESTSPHGGIR
jgi:anti-sigma B factor antagonist